MPKITEITMRTGQRRFRFVVDVSPKPGERRQITKTLDTREEAERELAALEGARSAWRISSRETMITDLFRDGICHPMCVFAWGTEEEGCACACRGRFHGRLSEMRATWAHLEVGSVRARRSPQREQAITPEFRQRVLALRDEALRHPAYRHRPATYVRERLAEDGVTVAQWQVNSWFASSRRSARFEHGESG